jgi:hypothetical protein
MPMSTTAAITLADYDRKIADGDFEPPERHRLELIRGELVIMPPIGSEHEVVVDFFAEWSIRHLPHGKASLFSGVYHSPDDVLAEVIQLFTAAGSNRPHPDKSSSGRRRGRLQDAGRSGRGSR